MELNMPITRVLLKSGCGSPQNTPALTVQPAQLLSSGSVPAQQSELSSVKADVMVGVTKICDSNKYKMSVARRNERERRRVQNVNRTFDTLRHHVQGYKNANKKMSKVETLRCAAEYIRELQTILGLGCSDEEHSLSRADSPMSATIFDYQMPVTPNSQPDSVTQTTFDFSQQTFDSPKSKIASSPLRSPAPMETPDPRPKSASPVSCGSILATCLQMPSIASCDAVVKQEPDGSPTDAFDLNGNSTISTASDGTDNILDEQSYNKLAAALQHHGPQLNLSLCGNYLQQQQQQQLEVQL